MKKLAGVIVTHETEKTLLAWARDIGERCPTSEAAATLALEEFAKDRKALLERIADARRAVLAKVKVSP